MALPDFLIQHEFNTQLYRVFTRFVLTRRLEIVNLEITTKMASLCRSTIERNGNNIQNFYCMIYKLLTLVFTNPLVDVLVRAEIKERKDGPDVLFYLKYLLQLPTDVYTYLQFTSPPVFPLQS